MDRDEPAAATVNPLAAQHAWTISLPEQVRDNDSRLRATARQLLRLPDVRSVTINGDRQQATVRLHPRRSNGVLIAEFSTIVLQGESLDATSSESVVSWIDARDQSWSFISLPAAAGGFKRLLLLAVAALAVVLGLVGVVLPGLPTTPFVLVASYCLLRSSPRLHARMLNSNLFGSLLRDWHLHRGLRPHVRYKATAVIVLVLGASVLFTALPLAVKFVILAVGIVGATYVWRLPSVED
jgi:uncharacterized membrane protein YbaN (DUF454 family)